MALITVVVPAYKVEKYLRRCIDSILDQSFADYQLILVDDGSADASGQLCDEYAAADSRVVVIHQKNGGVSSARNAALEFCESQYVTFCDSDDYWARDWLYSLYSTMVSSDADVVSADLQFVMEDGTLIQKTEYQKGSFVIQNESERLDFIIHQILECRLGWAVYTRLFKTGIIKQNNIRFCETCENFAEDLCFTLEYSLYCKRIETCNSCGYYYVQHQGSMMASSMKTTKLNAVNEVSKQFGKRFFSCANSTARQRVFPVIHYLIFKPEYNKIFEDRENRQLRAGLSFINDGFWYRQWTFRSFKTINVFQKYLGREKTKEAIRTAMLCLYDLWELYDLYKKGKRIVGGWRR